MTKTDDCADMAIKGIEVTLTAVLILLVRDHNWPEDKAQAFLVAIKEEVGSIAAWLEQRIEQ